ncbi:MAG: hypothetical protein AAB361_01220 [Patescibacteria group bacterium]
MPSQDINVTALIKKDEKYIFLYSDENRDALLRVLGRLASDPDLGFTWYDAAIVSQKIRQGAQEAEKQEKIKNRFGFYV